MQPQLAQISGITLFMQPVQDITVEDRVSRTQFQYTLEDPNADELNAFAPQMLAKLQQQPELRDVTSDQQALGLRAKLVFDRDTASRLGITPAAIDQTLYDSYGQRQVSTMFTQLNQYHVVLEVKPNFDRNPTDLRDLYIRSGAASNTASSGLVAGGTATSQTFGPSSTPSANAASLVQHLRGRLDGIFDRRSDRVVAGLCQRQSSALERVHPLGGHHRSGHGQSPGPVPGGHAVFQPGSRRLAGRCRKSGEPGQAGDRDAGQHSERRSRARRRSFRTSLANEPLLILAAVVTVYIVLGVLYESYIHPITILSTLPSAGVGALLALLICRIDFSVIALIGIVLLIGIVKKNAIMMIDFALEAERKEGKTPLDAIYQACLLRFRPIMMTTMAALLGGLPLALGSGTGSELRRPLGITIVGGLLLSQLLTLYTTPVIYLWFDRLARRFSKRGSEGPSTELVPVK